MSTSNSLNPTKVRAEVVSPSLIQVKTEDLPVSVQRCWDTLTKPQLVGMWFGNLSVDLDTAPTASLDFGDGDFFTLEEVKATSPTSLNYSWQFLGMGARSYISWTIFPTASGSTVTLTDRNPVRTKDSAEELRQGWLDFFQRLEHFASTGESCRYDFSHDFSGSIDLPFTIDTVVDILRTQGGLHSIAGLVINAPDTAQQVVQITSESDTSLHFDLSRDDWSNPTKCHLKVKEKSGRASIVVEQNGWDHISSDSSVCIAQRKVYSQKWQSALREAKVRLEHTAVQSARI